MCLALSLCSAQAPGDEAARCTTDHSNPPIYPDNERTLMDSYSYVNLLPGNGTGQPPEDDAVWNDMSYDGNDVVDTLNPTYVSSDTSLSNGLIIVSIYSGSMVLEEYVGIRYECVDINKMGPLFPRITGSSLNTSAKTLIPASSTIQYLYE